MIIWVIWWFFDWLFDWLFDVYLWLFVWVLDYLKIIWLIIWWLFFRILDYLMLIWCLFDDYSNYLMIIRHFVQAHCSANSSATAISLSCWACLHCGLQTICNLKPGSDGEADTESLTGRGFGACCCAGFAAAGRPGPLDPGPWTPTSD